MIATYEFEIFRDEGWFLAFPYDMEGGTQGEDFDDICMMAADWLRATMESYLVDGKPFPKATFGNAPRHGGKNVVFSVDVTLEGIPHVCATEAARMLGVSPARVSQLIAKGWLTSWKVGRNTYVGTESIKARLKDKNAWLEQHPKTAKVS